LSSSIILHPAYADTPSLTPNRLREFPSQVAPNGPFTLAGDPAKAAKAIVSVLDMEKAPLRLALGEDAMVHFELKIDGLKEQVEVHKELSLSTNFD
jgi:hypothetical protein